MDDETPSFTDSDFEFFVIILHNPREKLRLPAKFAELLDGQESRAVKLREASGGVRVWDVELLFDGQGQMYLERGWEQFARAQDLGLGNILVFSYDGGAVLTVKVFDGTMCRRHYRDDDDASATSVPGSSQPVTIKEEEFSIAPGNKSNGDSGSTNNIDYTGGSNNISDSGSKYNSSSAEMDIDAAPRSQFIITLKPSNLLPKQQQYLNVPSEFDKAHGYDKRSDVVLRMRGEDWTVKLKHKADACDRTRVFFRYGWHQFCVDNRLGVGDICFFRALRGEGEDHALKVEVRKLDGTFLD